MEVKGFDNSIRTEYLIGSAIAAGRFPHAAIIEGGSESDRLDLARRISEALMCSDTQVSPCGACSNCIKAKHSSHPDIMFLEPAKKTSGSKEATYHADMIRDEIIPGLYIKPNEGNYKILVFNKAEKIYDRSQNMLLKTIEDPPKYAVFIFLCESKDIFLPTILSRATLYNIGDTDVESAVTYEDAENAAQDVALAVLAQNEYDIIRAAAVFDKNQELLTAAVPVMEEIFAEAMKIKFGAEDNPKYSSCSEKLASELTRNALLGLIAACEELTLSRKYNANLNLSIVRLCTMFRAAAKEQE